VGEGATEGNVDRYTVAQAADMLEISSGAVRSRLSRGTLQSVREGGTVYVLLPASMSSDAGRDAAGMSSDMPASLFEQMRSRIESLERQLEQANERDRENRRIIAALTSRIPAIEASQEARESPETVEEEPERAAPPRSSAGEGQESEQRPWWRRMFGS
jgi:hypothetical protein